MMLSSSTSIGENFELVYEIPVQRNHRLIECQDCNKSSQEIVRWSSHFPEGARHD